MAESTEKTFHNPTFSEQPREIYINDSIPQAIADGDAPGSPIAEGTKVYGILAEFADPGAVFHAAEHVRDAGFKKWDVYASYPIHGINEAMGLKQSKITYFTAFGAIAGLGAAAFMQWYMNAFDYQTITAGKPLLAWEQSLPIGFELTVLIAAISTILGMFILNGLPRHHHSLLKNKRFVHGAGDDKFLIAIECKDPQYDEEKVAQMFRDLKATAVERVEA